MWNISKTADRRAKRTKMWEKLKIPAAYGPVLRKLQSVIFFAIFGRSP